MNKRLININELSEYIGLSTSTINSRIDQRMISFVKDLFLIIETTKVIL